jgi:hypothetical protein
MQSNHKVGLGGAMGLSRGPFLRALLPMVITWTVWVVLATLGGYPGVICITPMAWLLALWSGMQYATLTVGQPARWPLLAPALVGAVLGLYLGLTFVVVGTVSLTAGLEGEELARTWGFNLLMLVVSIPICAALSVFTAWLVRRRTSPPSGG